jgi:hypothetical protein
MESEMFLCEGLDHPNQVELVEQNRAFRTGDFFFLLRKIPFHLTERKSPTTKREFAELFTGLRD